MRIRRVPAAGSGSFSGSHTDLTNVTSDQHHAKDHAINGATHTGTLDDAQIPASIARDSEVTTAVTTHEAASDPHTGYQKESEKGAANGYASLDGSGLVPDAQIPAAIARDSEIPAAGTTPVQIDIGDTQAGGSGTTWSKNDHQHAFPAPSTGYPVDVDATEADGTATTPARSDHKHAHPASQHQSGGAMAIKLDDLAAPDDNTDLDASTTKHGLLQKLPGGTTTFLRADGSFAAPTAAAADPAYAPGSFTVVTETARAFFNHMKLTSTQRATVQGTGRLRLSN